MTTEIVAFDLETTGLSPLKGHRVVEIGAVRVEAGEMSETFHTLIDCGRPISQSASQISGITDAMLKGKATPLQAFCEFKAFIGNTPLVAHHAEFDRLFLQFEFSRLGWCLINKVLCTLRLSRQKRLDLPNYRLETVAKHLFGEAALEKRQAHRALDDARLTAQIWLALETR